MRLIAICTAVALAAGTVSAQVPGQPQPPRLPDINPRLAYGGSVGEFQDRLTSDILELERNGAQPGERATLIERVWPLVAEGRCNDARQLARQEGDRAVSRRIGQVCVEGRPTALPEDGAR